MISRSLGTLLRLLLTLAVLPAGAAAQALEFSGRVVEERSGRAVAGATITLVGSILTGTGLTLDQAVAALERGESPPLTDVQRRMVEEHAATRFGV